MLNVFAVEDLLPKDVTTSKFLIELIVYQRVNFVRKLQTKLSHNVTKLCRNMVRHKETKSEREPAGDKEREKNVVYYFSRGSQLCLL